MPEMLNTSKIPESLKHLTEGVKPIMASLGTPEDFASDWPELSERFYGASSTAHNVNYSAHPSYFKDRGFLNDGRQTYVISALDAADKFSERLYDCTGLIVAGVDQSTGENISFITHQNSSWILNERKKVFIEHLRNRFNEMQMRCKPGSIDVIIIAGDVGSSLHPYMENTSTTDTYIEAVKLLGQEVKESLGFDPVVVNGPKHQEAHGNGVDDLYYENKERRLYLIRSRVNKDTTSFFTSDIEKEREKWDKDPKKPRQPRK